MYEVESAVIDTNVLIYDLVEDSIYHSEASRILDELREWVIPSIVVYEFVWFIRGLGIETSSALEIISQYIYNEKTVIKPVLDKHIARALRMIAHGNLSLSRYNDKTILALALDEDKPIATFDRKLRSQAREYRVGVIPGQL